MYLIELVPDLRNRDSRRDLSSPYAMHQTLARVMAENESTPPPRFLWRKEPTMKWNSAPRVLIQSPVEGHWERLPIGYGRWEIKPLPLDSVIQSNRMFRFRLYANPTVTRNGKRLGLWQEDDQRNWLIRQGERHGFDLPDQNFIVSGNRLRFTRKQGQPSITLDTALFEGVLTVRDPELLKHALIEGIGHGKAFGLGMISLGRV